MVRSASSTTSQHTRPYLYRREHRDCVELSVDRGYCHAHLFRMFIESPISSRVVCVRCLFSRSVWGFNPSFLCSTLILYCRRHKHRRAGGLSTHLDDMLSHILTPSLAAYEAERVTGHSYGCLSHLHVLVVVIVCSQWNFVFL